MVNIKFIYNLKVEVITNKDIHNNCMFLYIYIYIYRKDFEH